MTRSHPQSEGQIAPASYIRNLTTRLQILDVMDLLYYRTFSTSSVHVLVILRFISYIRILPIISAKRKHSVLHQEFKFILYLPKMQIWASLKIMHITSQYEQSKFVPFFQKTKNMFETRCLELFKST